MRSNTAAKSDFTRELLLDDSISSRSISKNLSTVSDFLYLDMIENSGLYIEIGPGNGIEDSLTLHLENSGWRGLLIEKYTDKFAACILNRPNSAVVNDDCLSHSNGCKLVDILKEYDIHEAKLLVINQEGNIAGTLKEMLRSDLKPATLIFSKAVSNVVHNLLTLQGYRLQEQKGDTSQCGIICYRRQKAFRNITPFENKPIQKDRVSLLKNYSLMEMSKVNNLETDLKILEKEAHQYLIDILSIVKHKSNFLDGNLFYVNMIEAENVIPSEELKTKRENFLFLTKNANNILEIGFNAGHSTLIALLANKKSKITVIDTCEHIYTEETFNYLSSKFPNRLKLIKGNSTKILPSIKDKFDLIHFDGGKEKTILKDLEYSKNIVKSEHVLIIDDTQNRKLLSIIDKEINNFNIEINSYIILSKRCENLKWKHLIATFIDKETFATTKNILKKLYRIYDHNKYSSIYTNSTDVNKVAGFSRAYSLVDLVKRTKDLHGDFVECGVAAGHSSVIASLALQQYKNNESLIHLYDTYEGFSFSLEDEFDFKGTSIKDYDLSKYNTIHTREKNVLDKMLNTGWRNEKLKMYKGRVENPIPTFVPKAISILRLDMDLYEPTKHALEHLYPLVQEGGFIIIDDYGHGEGCRKAVNEFFEKNNLNIEDLIYIDYTCRVFKKNNKNLTIKGSLGGGWDEETHLKLYAKNFNQGMANYIVNEIAPKSFLEFGSGLGFLAKHIDENLSLESSFCIEPNYIKGLYGEMINVKFLQLDIFKDDIPIEIDQNFDLVISIEVAEHLERNKHNYLFNFLVNKTKNWLVFSGARIGQGGHGHISERAEDDWKGEFLYRGMIFDEQRTENIRNACDKKNINHRKNVMVFYKPSFIPS